MGPDMYTESCFHVQINSEKTEPLCLIWLQNIKGLIRTQGKTSDISFVNKATSIVISFGIICMKFHLHTKARVFTQGHIIFFFHAI